jgi:hypothetical protein
LKSLSCAGATAGELEPMANGLNVTAWLPPREKVQPTNEGVKIANSSIIRFIVDTRRLYSIERSLSTVFGK